MSDCARKDIRNLDNLTFRLDEFDGDDIAAQLEAGIKKAISGEELEHSVSELGKGWDKAVDKGAAWFGDKVGGKLAKMATAGVVKTTKAFGKELEPAKVEKLFKAGIHQKLMDEQDRAYNVFAQRLTLNAQDNLNKMDRFSDDEVAGIYDFLDGQKELGELAEHTRSAAQSFRNIIDKNANELVELGVLRQEDKIKNYVKHYFEGYKEKSEAEFAAHLKNTFGLDRTYKRKDLTPEQLKELGLMRDKYAIVNTIKEQFIEIEKARRLKSLAENFARSKETAGWVRFGVDESGNPNYKKWGALAGKWVSPEMNEAIQSAQIASNITNNALNNYFAIVAHLKTNLTVKNPVTHLYNYLSNVWTAALKGDLIATQKMAAEAVAGTQSFKAWRRLGYEHGLSMTMDELDIAKGSKTLIPDKASMGRRLLRNAYMSENSAMGKFMRELYNMEDGVFKLAHFKKIMKKEKINGQSFDIKKYFSDNEYKKLWRSKLESAMKKANYEYVDYSTSWSGAARFADRAGLAPFLQYTWKSVPMVAKNILKNPHRYALLSAGLGYTGGLSLFNREQKDAGHEKWAGNGNLLFTGGRLPNMFFADMWVKTGKGDLEFNLGRMVPGARFGDLSSVFQGGFVKSFFDTMSGKTSLGFNYIKDDDSAGVAAAKMAEELAKNYLPSLTFGRYAINLEKMLFNEIASKFEFAKKYNLPVAKDSRGNEIGVYELALRMLGVRDMRRQKAYQQSYNKALKEAKKLESDGDKAEAKELRDKAKRIKNYAKSDNKKLKEPRK